MKQFSAPGSQLNDSRPEFMPRPDTDRVFPVDNHATPTGSHSFWHKWYGAFKQVFPVYFAVHVAFLIITGLSFIFITQDFNANQTPLHMFWQVWNRWDTGHYIHIATFGYTETWRTAFFPLYPLMMRGLMFFIPNSLIAGLIISDIACLVMLVILYQLVSEDFDSERAQRTILYLSIFPTAFFFAAAYTESLFLCLILLSFYNMRRGQWWLAALFGFFASLTRSAGILLLLPFCYEYLRHCQFQWKKIRFSVMSMALIPIGVSVFALYCYLRFGDALAFSHAEAHWGRDLAVPWWGVEHSLLMVLHNHPLSWPALHNMLDLGPTLLVFVLIILSVVGPWRFPKAYWSYCLYAAIVYLFTLLFPINWVSYPIMSFGRYMLGAFPAFIILAALGKHRIIHLTYLIVASSTMVCLLTLFLMGRLVI